MIAGAKELRVRLAVYRYLGSIPLSGHTEDFRNGIYSFPIRRSARKRHCREKQPSLLAVPSEKRFKNTPPSLMGKQVVGPSSIPIAVTPLGKSAANKARARTHKSFNVEISFLKN